MVSIKKCMFPQTVVSTKIKKGLIFVYIFISDLYFLKNIRTKRIGQLVCTNKYIYISFNIFKYFYSIYFRLLLKYITMIILLIL